VEKIYAMLPLGHPWKIIPGMSTGSPFYLRERKPNSGGYLPISGANIPKKAPRSGCKTYEDLRKRAGQPFLLITLSFLSSREEVVLVSG
jgi:hypothetical protein